jgi:hypothetical protein
MPRKKTRKKKNRGGRPPELQGAQIKTVIFDGPSIARVEKMRVRRKKETGEKLSFSKALRLVIGSAPE